MNYIFALLFLISLNSCNSLAHKDPTPPQQQECVNTCETHYMNGIFEESNCTCQFSGNKQ